MACYQGAAGSSGVAADGLEGEKAIGFAPNFVQRGLAGLCFRFSRQKGNWARYVSPYRQGYRVAAG